MAFKKCENGFRLMQGQSENMFSWDGGGWIGECTTHQIGQIWGIFEIYECSVSPPNIQYM